MPQSLSTNLKFISAWMRSPLKMGAALPSSKALARAMAAQINQGSDGAVVELGAGTGVVTHAILESGISTEKLLVIEREKKLHSLLTGLYPNVRILCEDAMELDKVLEKSGIQKVNAIVSSLPFLSMPQAVRQGIQEQMAKAIGDDGVIIQFTYGSQSPIDVDKIKNYKLAGKEVKFVMLNFPPAHVWVYQRSN